MPRKYRLYNPETGGTGDVDADVAQKAIAAGAIPVGDVEMYNPETGKTGVVKPDTVSQALAAGAHLVDSAEHHKSGIGYAESLGRGALQGATMGFSDEIVGALESAFTDKTYEQARNESRAANAIAQEANPWTYGAGEMGGGLATALVPVGRVATTGAKLATTLGREALLGAGLGALSGAGYSEAEKTADLIGDTAQGAGLGLATAGAAATLSHAVPAIGKVLGKSARETMDPTLQRMIATGGRTKNFTRLEEEGFRDAVETANKMGLYNAAEGELLPPDLPTLLRRFEDKRVDIADRMSTIFEQAGGAKTDLNQLFSLEDMLEIDNIVSRASPTEKGIAKAARDEMLQRIAATDGNLGKLWQVKKDLGRYVGKDFLTQRNLLPAESEVYMKLNGVLRDQLNDLTEEYSLRAGNESLRELNKQYGAVVKLRDIADKQNSINAHQATRGPFSFREWVAGVGAGALIDPATGLALATTHKAVQSTQGRLVRAKIGEKLHLGQQQQAIAMGAVPRTTEGVKGWLAQYGGMLDQAMPGMRQNIEKILASPPDRAEAGIRGLMPLFQDYMTPSEYPSEFNGKVSSPEDMQAAATKLENMGLKPTELAIRKSALNKDGTLWPGVFAPQESYDEDILDFAKRLEKLGY